MSLLLLFGDVGEVDERVVVVGSLVEIGDLRGEEREEVVESQGDEDRDQGSHRVEGFVRERKSEILERTPFMTSLPIDHPN